MEPQTSRVRLLQPEVDIDGSESYFRLLVDETSVRYLTIDWGVYDPLDLTFEPTFVSLLPSLPPGDWNRARVSLDPATEKPHFVDVEKADLRGVTTAWHPVNVDFLELHKEMRMSTNIFEGSCATIDGPFVAKFARFEWEIGYLEDEIERYQWIEGHDIGPKFLGNITEEGRVIGFLMSKIADFRHATSEDLPLCTEALSKLHQLGIKHGDINKHNFLIYDGKVTILDFESATKTSDAAELREELEDLAKSLASTSRKGGHFMVEHRTEEYIGLPPKE